MSQRSQRISRADRRALARLRLRDARDGFCGPNHAIRQAELAGLTPSQIIRELGADLYYKCAIRQAELAGLTPSQIIRELGADLYYKYGGSQHGTD